MVVLRVPTSTASVAEPTARAGSRATASSILWPPSKITGRSGAARTVTQPRANALATARRTTASRHGLPVADNVLDRDFAPAGPNATWSADITSVPTADGWLYLAVVEDLFSRMIVDWAMDGAMTSRLVVDALEMAVRRRLPG